MLAAADAICKGAIDLYRLLPINGKPDVLKREITVMACVCISKQSTPLGNCLPCSQPQLSLIIAAHAQLRLLCG